MPEFQTLEDFGCAPSIADDERIAFDIRHVRSVQRHLRKGRFLRALRHPVTLVIVTWILMAALLALEMYVY